MWTDRQVESWMVEAVDTLRRLPNDNPLYGSLTYWPDIRKFPQDDWPVPSKLQSGPPPRAHISRYLTTLGWLEYIQTKNWELDRDILFWTCWYQYGEPRQRITFWDVIRARTRTRFPDWHCRRIYNNGLAIICGRLNCEELRKAINSQG